MVRRRRTAALAALATVSLLPACTGDEDAGRADESPVDLALTRATSESLRIGGPGGTLSGVEPPGPDGRWVVAGNRVDAEGASTPSVWWSTDGRTWEEEPVEPGGGRPHVTDVARRDGTTVLVGQRRRDGDVRGAAWVAEGDGGFEPVDEGALGAERASSVDEVVAVSDGFVATGRVGSGDDAVVALWRSPDGRTWEHLDAAVEAVEASEDAGVTGVAEVDGRLVLGGWVRRDGAGDAAIWHEGDDGSWSTVDDAPGFRGRGEQLITDLSTGAGELLAVGRVEVDGTMEAAAWRSADVSGWEQLEAVVERFVRGSSTWGIGLASVRRDGDGYVGIADGELVPMVVRSDDGATWVEDEPSEELFGDTAYDLGDLAVGAGGTVVAVPRGQAPIVLLASPGEHTTDVSATTDAFPAARPGAGVRGVVATAGGLVAWGWRTATGRGPGATTTDAHVWRSADGEDWAEVPDDGAFAGAIVTDAVADDDRVVAVGTEPFHQLPGARDPNPLTWLATGERWARSDASAAVDRPGVEEANVGFDVVVRHGDRFVAAGSFYGEDSERVEPVIATSADGERWEPVPAGAPPRAVGHLRIADLCSHGSTLTAVAGVQAGSRRRALAWTSADGASWERAEVDVDGAAQAGLTACATTSSGLVAVGWRRDGDEPHRPAVWRSPDGRGWQPVDARSLGRPDARVDAVAADGDTVVAVGVDDTELDGDPAVWRSDDGGATWRQLRLDLAELRGASGQSFDAVLLRGGRLTIGGSVDGEPAIWTGELG